MTDSLEKRFPLIKWEIPINVTVPEAGTAGLACRRCVATYGLRAQDVGNLFKTAEEFKEHLVQFHERTVSDD